MKRESLFIAAVAAIALCAGAQKASAGNYGYDWGWNNRPWYGYGEHAWGYGASVGVTYPYAGYGSYGLAVDGCYRRLTWVQTVYYGMQQAWVTQCY